MDWIRGDPIGQGSSATVSIGMNNSSGEVFAVKSMELAKSSVLQREEKILRSIKSPHVVSYMGCDVTNENGNLMFNLFMEYVAGGSLSNAIQSQGGRLEEDFIRSYTKEILLGVDHLHMNGLVHCDIKGRNILVGPEGEAKIADLGCAKWADEVVPISGTPVYMAPEVALGEAQSFAADVWAVGCTMIEMATGRAPWPEVKNNVSALYKIGFSGEVPEFPSFLSEEAKDFLSKCLQRSAKDRWTIKQLLDHPFVIQYSKEIQVSTTNSPTSILDQGLWDSIQESEATTHISRSNSTFDRLRKISSPVVPNWASEENWVTIRTSEERQDCLIEVRNNEPATISGSDSEQIGCSVSSVSDRDFIDISVAKISGISDRISSNLCRKRCLGDVCKCCVDRNLNFETQRELIQLF